jgi:hypothetical protein
LTHLSVQRVVCLEQNNIRTKLFANKNRHTTFDPKLSRLIWGSHYHWAIIYDYRFINKLRILANFNSSKEHVHVNINPCAIEQPLLFYLCNNIICILTTHLPIPFMQLVVMYPEFEFPDSFLNLNPFLLLFLIEFRIFRWLLNYPLYPFFDCLIWIYRLRDFLLVCFFILLLWIQIYLNPIILDYVMNIF